MKRKVYLIRTEQLQEVYKCMTPEQATLICQEHYQLYDTLPDELDLDKSVVYWIENKKAKCTSRLNTIDDFDYIPIIMSDITSKLTKSYYIKVEDILELNETIPFSMIDNYLSYYGFVGSVKRVANKNQYVCWTKGESLSYIENYKPNKGFIQLTVKDILKFHLQHYENRLQKQETDVVRGNDTEGNRVQSRKCKTAITVGHLSYKSIKG